MTISLAPDLEKLVNDTIASGRFRDSTEVIREALLLLEERENLSRLEVERLQREIQIGIDQIERGEYTDYTEETLGELARKVKRVGREMLATGRDRSG